jgi:hypothetical protein
MAPEGSTVHALEAGRIVPSAAGRVRLLTDSGLDVEYAAVGDAHLESAPPGSSNPAAGAVIGVLTLAPRPTAESPGYATESPRQARGAVGYTTESPGHTTESPGHATGSSDHTTGWPTHTTGSSDHTTGSSDHARRAVGYARLTVRVLDSDGTAVDAAALLVGLTDPAELGVSASENGLGLDPDGLDRELGADSSGERPT